MVAKLLAMLLVALSQIPALGGMVFQIQGASEIRFSANVLVGSGSGFVSMPVSPSILSSPLAGTFEATVGSPTLTVGGSISQAADVTGDVLNSLGQDVGNVSLIGADRLQMTVGSTGNTLIVQSGLISYDVNSVSPALVINGAYPLTGAILTVLNLQYGTQSGLNTASFDFALSGLAPTTAPNAFIEATITGKVVGLEITSVPEATSVRLLLFAFLIVWVTRGIERHFPSLFLNRSMLSERI